MAGPRVVVASNRGPVSFVREEDGTVSLRRGPGGLVTALTGALEAAGGLWVASAMTDEDRAQAVRGPVDVGAEGAPYMVRYLDIDPDDYDRYYNGISNGVLWFLHHCLWDTPRMPRFDEETHRDWVAYRQVNDAFAEALDEEGDADFLIQDYHLALAPASLRARRPDARIAYFSHIPFAGSSYFRILPRAYREQLLNGLLGADVVGFHAEDWAQSFLVDCRELRGARVNLIRRTIRWQGRQIAVRVYPISIDVQALRADADAPEVEDAQRRLRDLAGDRRLLLRVDRAEISKNILRGFEAFELFLERSPEWRDRVVFVAQLNPSRENVPGYAEYLEQCEALAESINERFGAGGRRPVELTLADDFPMALAGYLAYDVLMVNPMFDGMNLVAKEGPSLNRNDGVLLLSENAGAFPELGRHAVRISPFDVTGTADAIRAALEMPRAERRQRARGLRAAVARNSLDRWVGNQLADLRRAAASR